MRRSWRVSARFRERYEFRGHGNASNAKTAAIATSQPVARASTGSTPHPHANPGTVVRKPCPRNTATTGDLVGGEVRVEASGRNGRRCHHRHQRGAEQNKHLPDRSRGSVTAAISALSHETRARATQPTGSARRRSSRSSRRRSLPTNTETTSVDHANTRATPHGPLAAPLAKPALRRIWANVVPRPRAAPRSRPQTRHPQATRASHSS